MPSIRYPPTPEPRNKHELRGEHPRRLLQVVTGVNRYLDRPGPRTGLWLGELSHSWDVFMNAGFEQVIASPSGGAVPLEPKSIRFPNFDASTRAWYHDKEKMALLDDVASLEDVSAADFDAIFLTGGHAVMYDFPGCDALQRLIRDIYEAGGAVGSVCHGYCGLLETKLSDGSLLIAGKKLTGFSWVEEVLAGVAEIVPYNVEQSVKERGATYSKGLVPFISHTETDGRLVTGQNPASARAAAHKLVERIK